MALTTHWTSDVNAWLEPCQSIHLKLLPLVVPSEAYGWATDPDQDIGNAKRVVLVERSRNHHQSRKSNQRSKRRRKESSFMPPLRVSEEPHMEVNGLSIQVHGDTNLMHV